MLNCEFSRQEERFNVLKNKEKELVQQCQMKAKQLEDSESENRKKCDEVMKTFSKMVWKTTYTYVIQIPYVSFVLYLYLNRILLFFHFSNHLPYLCINCPWISIS